MIKELRETIDNELKEIRKTIYEQNEKIYEEIEIVKRKQIEIQELKSTAVDS